MAKDYYQTLGVQKSASPDEVKKAFRELAHKHHPDKQGGDAAKFKEINEAYQVLGNAEKRAKYDQFGSAAFDGSGGGGGAGGFDPGGFGNINVDMGDLGDIFGSMFGGQQRGQQPARGQDIEVDLDLTFREAAFGTDREVKLRKRVRCTRCAGGGVEPGSKMIKCETCGGRGRVQAVARTMFGNMQTVRDCADCHARGEKPEKNCTECSGTGAKTDNVTVKMKIPAGVDEGGVMRLRGEGEAGDRGTPSGDLYIKLHVEKDDEFTREGTRVLSSHHITFTQAALGDSIEVNTIHGAVSLKIPAGTQSHTDFRLRGKGIRGDDQITTIIVETPTKLSREQKRLLEELALKE